MRAVNHPARWRVLEELWKGRILTATEAAELVGLSPSAMSYHLNQLGRLGLVEQVASDNGRERPWRAVSEGVTMSARPDAEVGRVMMRNLLASVGRLLTTPPPADAGSGYWPAAFSTTTLRLRPTQAQQLHQEVGDVIAKYQEIAASQDDNDPAVAAADYDVFWIQGVTSADPTSR